MIGNRNPHLTQLSKNADFDTGFSIIMVLNIDHRNKPFIASRSLDQLLARSEVVKGESGVACAEVINPYNASGLNRFHGWPIVIASYCIIEKNRRKWSQQSVMV